MFRPGLRIAGALAQLAGATAARSIRARTAALESWLAWRARPAGPLVWIHAASVGELLTAEPIFRRVKAARPDAGCMLTFTSPSAADWPAPGTVDRAGYLPAGDRASMESLFEHLRPTVLAFARGDLWPGVARAAERHRIPVLLVSATVRPHSTRLHAAVRPFLRPAYQRVRWAGAVSHEDAQRLRQLGVAAGVIETTGDARHDQILEREVRLEPIRDLLTWTGADALIVAGSTHSEDEAVVLPAFRAVAARHPVRLLLVPHEPSAGRVASLLASAREMSLTVSAELPGSPETRIIVSPGTGLLADLYAAASVAYVGGGFGRGLHAVAEPAAFAVPVTFGLRDSAATSADGASLVAAGGGTGVRGRGAFQALTEQWLRWLEHPVAARQAGLAARRILRGGAADASAAAILRCC